MVVSIALDYGAGGNHLGVQHAVLADQAQKIATVTIGPVEHGCNAEFSVNVQWLSSIMLNFGTDPIIV